MRQPTATLTVSRLKFAAAQAPRYFTVRNDGGCQPGLVRERGLRQQPFQPSPTRVFIAAICIAFPARPSDAGGAAFAVAARRRGDDRQGVGDEDGRAEVLLRRGHGSAHGPGTRDDRDAGAGPACVGKQ